MKCEQNEIHEQIRKYCSKQILKNTVYKEKTVCREVISIYCFFAQKMKSDETKICHKSENSLIVKMNESCYNQRDLRELRSERMA